MPLYSPAAPIDASYLLRSANGVLTDDHVLTAGTNITLTPGAGTLTIDAASGGGSSLPVADTQTIVMGSADNTKLLRFEIDGFTAGATRVMTPPNQDTLLAGQNFLNVFTVNQTFQADLISDRGLGGNRFFAGGAGNATMSGDEIVGIGAGAIDSNTTGARNFALGTNALTANTTGNDNTAIGIDSLKANQAGVQHLAIGKGTLESMNGGQDNIAIGTFALQNMVNSLSIANIAIGSGTMRNITSEALNNVAIGFETMGNGGAASCGNENTAVGYKTMSLINSTSAEKNTGVGAISMLFISSGARNVGIGWGAGFSLTSGSGNVFIGVQAGWSVTTQSNQLYIANSDTTSPLIYGEFDNAITRINGRFQVHGLADQIQAAVKAHSTQTNSLMEIQDNSAGIYSRFNKAGYFMTRKLAAPADADLATSEMALWFDDTAGAAKLMIKAKNASGTVVTGNVALT